LRQVAEDLLEHESFRGRAAEIRAKGIRLRVTPADAEDGRETIALLDEWYWTIDALPETDVLEASRDYLALLNTLVEECEERFSVA